MRKPLPFESDARAVSQRGSAVVDFVLVGALLTLIFLSVLQLALILHVRNTLIDAAASGARFGTLADRSPEEAVNRTKALIDASLNPTFSQQISYSEQELNGVDTLTITVRAPFPVIGFLGLEQSLEVTGHAVVQR
ncbi:TadE family protein [Psychromicrobium sp. YIM B11713]|uniref:TadE family protein n=1 Tax=Psychromicrobium sp. YIM B11713 TaxID=3145233 RepID=UPI00374F6096